MVLGSGKGREWDGLSRRRVEEERGLLEGEGLEILEKRLRRKPERKGERGSLGKARGKEGKGGF